MAKLTINIEGKTLDDIKIALEEVERLVFDQWCTSGADRNEDSNFSFDLDTDPWD